MFSLKVVFSGILFRLKPLKQKTKRRIVCHWTTENQVTKWLWKSKQMKIVKVSRPGWLQVGVGALIATKLLRWERQVKRRLWPGGLSRRDCILQEPGRSHASGDGWIPEIGSWANQSSWWTPFHRDATFHLRVKRQDLFIKKVWDISVTSILLLTACTDLAPTSPYHRQNN